MGPVLGARRYASASAPRVSAGEVCAWGLLACTLLFGCQAPRPGADGQVGSVEELGQMMAAQGDVEPVVATVEEGHTAGIESDPLALADPETVDLVTVHAPAPEESPYILFGLRVPPR